MDSTKLLTEKLALSRELSSLKPEVDHLRSQATLHQPLLADKLSLQRQLSAIQVDLETEKRSVQRAQDREGKLQAKDARLESRLKGLQTDVAREQHERQKIEREAQKVSNEYENRKTTLESRLEAFKIKLKITKEQLKEAQSTVQTTHKSVDAASICRSASVNSMSAMGQKSCKRAAVQMDADSMIGTPGDLPVTKKSKKGYSLPGEKSAFSITPFLNRTGSVATYSPPDDVGCSEGIVEEPDSRVQAVKQQLASQATISERMNENKLVKVAVPSEESTSYDKMRTSKVKSGLSQAQKLKSASTLEQVAEEENIEHGASKSTILSKDKDYVHEKNGNNGLDVRRKKRKLLGSIGKTLFDEDQDGGFNGATGLWGGVNDVSRGGLGGAKLGFGNALRGKSTFGSTSPSKKDRK